FELTRTCATPLPRLLLSGAHECSPAPLYWMAQAAVVRSVDSIDGGILVKYRAVSLAAAGLAVLVLALATGVRLGLPAALAGSSPLLSPPMSHAYAAETRAYMTWLLASIALTLAAAEAALHGWAEASPFQRGRLVLVVLLAGLAAIPAGLQAVAVLAAGGFARPAGPARAPPAGPPPLPPPAPRRPPPARLLPLPR